MYQMASRGSAPSAHDELTREEWRDLNLRLRRPLPPELVRLRLDGDTYSTSQGDFQRVLCYVDRQSVADWLDTVVGAENWDFDWEEVSKDPKTGELKVVKGILTIRGVTKCDVGMASNTSESQGAISDAFKRCADLFGVARYLRSMKNMRARVEQRGTRKRGGETVPNYVMTEAEKQRLQKELVAGGMTYWKAGIALAHDLGGPLMLDDPQLATTALPAPSATRVQTQTTTAEQHAAQIEAEQAAAVPSDPAEVASAERAVEPDLDGPITLVQRARILSLYKQLGAQTPGAEKLDPLTYAEAQDGIEKLERMILYGGNGGDGYPKRGDA